MTQQTIPIEYLRFRTHCNNTVPRIAVAGQQMTDALRVTPADQMIFKSVDHSVVVVEDFDEELSSTVDGGG